ncbi:MAG: metallophosphoesterase [Defluviitaleaceae bacterium]|nr:metallophosphoesterase [Defluviitaleaceae bacterium]
MHKILVISDSHGKVAPIKPLLDRYSGNVQTVVHLGDNAKDLLQYQSYYPAINFVAVAGNCDFTNEVPRERILTIGGQAKVLLMHGHTHDVKSNYNRLIYYSLEKGVDACLFGHSHTPVVFSHESVFFMNPGSISEPRGQSKAGYGIVTIDSQGNINGEVLAI